MVGNFFQCVGAVGDFIFHLGGQFGEGLVVAVGDEQWVVAKAVFAAQFFDDDPFAGAFDGERFFAGTGEGDDGTEAGAAIFFSRELAQQFGVVRGVVARFAGVAGGIDAGRAVEGVNFEPRVVGEGGPAGCVAELLRFFYGVSGEGVAVFNRIGDVGEIECGADIHILKVKDGLNFFELVGVSGGDDNFHETESGCSMFRVQDSVF